MESWYPCDSLMNCTVQIRILGFVLLSKESLPYNRTLISLSWLWHRRDLSIFIKSVTSVSRISPKNGHHGKKCNAVSASMLQEHNGFKVSSKLCQNLSSRNWLNPNLNLVSNFIPTRSWMLKILFWIGLIKFNRGLQKLLQDKKLCLLRSSLFQSFMKHSKKEFWKYLIPQ